MDKSVYLFLTQFVIIIHMAFIGFVLVGGFFARKYRWIRVVHLSSVVWAVYAELAAGVICPLTDLENYFAHRAGLSTYEEDFILRYLVPIIYQENLTRTLQFILAAVVICVNAIAYRFLWLKKKEFSGRTDKGLKKRN